ncbi:multidrug transporter MatE [Endozoicomonas montiporae]|uniref:Multidrug export protein MepA n=2 Tax=Endozoicomonas montiporae TaxID=1027273 RepID=A0A081N2G8_9GAMM|nr:MATE family efflux transporter [Endozoicomonas montiporae]AMO58392.1 Na+ driven multidrug efflux pump [Endozoicomonas montiporae CL-33]KEQ12641.1 multidrug transporter MatE [Endozoicomonas montiporae]
MSKKTINLHEDPVRSSFYRYLLPALSGMLIKSLFIMGDAWFVGRGVGSEGLGAISLTMPFFSFFTAVAMMIGIGGAALMSIEFGKNNLKEGQTLFTQSLLFTAIIAVVLVAAGLYWLEDMMALVGARGYMAELANEYLGLMLKFFVIYALAWVLSCFVRNDTNPRLAMYAMSGGAVANLLLDYVFVLRFGWGMTGAALATGLSQILIICILLTHFISKRGHLRISFAGLGFDKVRGILKIGTPTFFIELTSAMTIMLFNIVLLNQYGEGHVVAYGLTANVGVFALFTMVGIGQACQPIISFNHGAQNGVRVRETLFLGLRSALVCGVCFLVIAWFAAESIARFYIVGRPELIELATTALRFYFLAPPLMGLNMIVANLFQATAQPNQATLLSLGRGFVFVVLGIIVLPRFFPENGIWASILFAETLTALFSVLMLWQFLKRSRLQLTCAAQTL